MFCLPGGLGRLCYLLNSLAAGLKLFGSYWRSYILDKDFRMIAYFGCACKSREKLLLKKLQNSGYEIRVVRTNPKWKAIARTFNKKMPFVVENGVAREL